MYNYVGRYEVGKVGSFRPSLDKLAGGNKEQYDLIMANTVNLQLSFDVHNRRRCMAVVQR